MRSFNISNPLTIVALGFAGAAALWGFAQVIPPIFEGIAVIIKAIGVAIGLATATATTGLATSGVAAAWLAPAAAAGIAAAGTGVTYVVLHKIVEKGKEKPYEWMLPALGLLAVFFVDLSKDELLTTGTERALFAFTTGCCTIGGGVLLLNKRTVVRALGFFLPFLPTLVVWGALVREGHIAKGLGDFIRGGNVSAIGLVGVLVMGSCIAVLGVLLPNRDTVS